MVLVDMCLCVMVRFDCGGSEWNRMSDMELDIFVIFTLAIDIFVIPLLMLLVHIGDNVTFKCGGMRVSLFSKDCPQAFILSN